MILVEEMVMAKLIVPEVGYRLRLASGKQGKVHFCGSDRVKLEAASLKDGSFTVCKYIIWDDTPKVKLADVKPEEICQKCLGAMRAEP